MIERKSNYTSLVPLRHQTDVIVVYIILLATVCVSLLLSILIIITISCTKALHTSANLLIVNTSVATILFVSIQTINISYFFWETVFDDWQCRIQAYIHYVFLNKVAYSYLLQGISRLLFTIVPRHRKILSCKMHIIFILIETFVILVFPLPTLITKDVVYRTLAICLIPMAHMIHVIYFFITSYFIPLLSVITVYLVIRHQVKLSTRALQNPAYLNKRDIELTRNILVLFLIFLFAGIPSVIYLLLYKITEQDLMSVYMFTGSATCVSTALEKISTLLVNKDLKKETKRYLKTIIIFYRSNQTDIQPFSLHSVTAQLNMRGSIQLPMRPSIPIAIRRMTQMPIRASITMSMRRSIQVTERIFH